MVVEVEGRGGRGEITMWVMSYNVAIIGLSPGAVTIVTILCFRSQLYAISERFCHS